MTTYELNRVLYELKINDDLVREMRQNFDEAIKRYDLSPEEIEAVRSKDDRAVLKLGARGNIVFAVHRLRPEFENATYFALK